NNQVKEWKKLHKRKFRKDMHAFLIEGFHLIEEAYKSGWEIETVIIQEHVIAPEWIAVEKTVRVARHVFNEISQTETTQGIAAVVKMNELEKVPNEHLLLVDAIQDPGNLGTIIRTADAVGMSQIILGTGTVDVYNDKVIRASQGS